MAGCAAPRFLLLPPPPLPRPRHACWLRRACRGGGGPPLVFPSRRASSHARSGLIIRAPCSGGFAALFAAPPGLSTDLRDGARRLGRGSHVLLGPRHLWIAGVRWGSGQIVMTFFVEVVGARNLVWSLVPARAGGRHAATTDGCQSGESGSSQMSCRRVGGIGTGSATCALASRHVCSWDGAGEPRPFGRATRKVHCRPPQVR